MMSTITAIIFIMTTMIISQSTTITSSDCIFMKSAFSEHPDVVSRHSQPYLFHPNTQLFDVSFFAVPGDEESWWNIRKKYSWNVVLSTHVFIAVLFQSFNVAGLDPLLIDVGLNMGQETIIVASLGGLALSFEPLPKSWTRVLFNYRVNCLNPKRVQILNYGIGNTVGKTIKANEDIFTPGSRNTPSNESNRGVDVNITTLDEQFYKNKDAFDSNKKFFKRPLLLKLDTEGHEYEAIEGAVRILTEYPPYFILIEIGGIENDKSLAVQKFREKLLPFGYVKVFVLSFGDAIVDEINNEKYFAEYWKRPIKHFKPAELKFGDYIFEHKDVIFKSHHHHYHSSNHTKIIN